MRILATGREAGAFGPDLDTAAECEERRPSWAASKGAYADL